MPRPFVDAVSEGKPTARARRLASVVAREGPLTDVPAADGAKRPNPLDKLDAAHDYFTPDAGQIVPTTRTSNCLSRVRNLYAHLDQRWVSCRTRRSTMSCYRMVDGPPR